MAASAAYWVASQADELVVTPGGIVGSIGVLTAHEDVSKAEEMAGVKTTVISAGKFKAEDHPFQPLSESARAEQQSMVDKYYNVFVSAVAKGRGVSLSTVRDGYGQGRVVKGEDALSMGMVDTVATLDQVITRLMGRPAQGSLSADMDMRQRRLRQASR